MKYKENESAHALEVLFQFFTRYGAVSAGIGAKRFPAGQFGSAFCKRPNCSPAKSRLEYRRDWSNQPFIERGLDLAVHKNQDTCRFCRFPRAQAVVLPEG